MSNNGSFSLGGAGRNALAFFEDELEPEEAEETEEEPTETSGGMSENRMAAIAGHWRVNTPNATVYIEYTFKDGELFAQVPDVPRFSVIPTSDSTVRLDGPEATVTFHFEDGTTVNRATHHQGSPMPMTRV